MGENIVSGIVITYILGEAGGYLALMSEERFLVGVSGEREFS